MKIIELTPNNYRQYLPIHTIMCLIANEYAEKPGDLILISGTKQAFHLNQRTDNWDIQDIHAICPILEFLHNGKPLPLFGWMQKYSLNNGIDVFIKPELNAYFPNHRWSTQSFNSWQTLSEMVLNQIEKTDESGCLYDKDTLILCANPTLQEYTVKNGTTQIGHNAFTGNHMIKKITLPDTIRLIDERAFHNCLKLSSINIPDSVEQIRTEAFLNCKSLKNIKIPSGIDWEQGAFTGCDNLDNIIFPEDMYIIPDSMFFWCDIPQITLPSNLLSIGNMAFESNMQLTKIVIPNTVISIGWSAFCMCKKLKEIVLPENLITIGRLCFMGCAIEKITIPPHVATIGFKTFLFCESLKSITFQGKPTPHLDRILSDIPNLEEINVPIQYKDLYLNALKGFEPHINYLINQ